MKLGVFTVLLSATGLEESLSYLKKSGVQAVELGAGGYPGKAHVNPELLLSNEGEIKKLKELIKKYDMDISALSCHGNPVHPQKEIAQS
ncbi:MAG: sugar phosphate isomerase/epimerase, partial [Ruminiclostridium sp.]|nr:sugar phosphate isomerase/epimerase [Ruminiclostridium sp.]